MYAGDNPDPDDVTEGDCFAEELMATSSAEELRAGGLVDDSYAVVTAIPTLEEELAGTVADAQLACTDFIEDSTAAQVSITKGRLDPGVYAECLAAELDRDQIRASVVASLMGDWEDPALVRLVRPRRPAPTSDATSAAKAIVHGQPAVETPSPTTSSPWTTRKTLPTEVRRRRWRRPGSGRPGRSSDAGCASVACPTTPGRAARPAAGWWGRRAARALRRATRSVWS